MTGLGRGRRHRPVGPARPGRAAELFAGSHRLADALAASGIYTHSYEISDSPDENVMSEPVTKFLYDSIARRSIRFVWIGITCASFSRARRNPHGYGHGWPPPLRGDSGRDLWGLPGLNAKDRERVTSGNLQARWTVALVRHCLKHNVAVVIENPRGSRLWLLPPIQRLAKSGQFSDVHYCQYGTPRRKATKLLSFNCDLFAIGKLCRPVKGLCSCSGKPHVTLSGRDPQGVLYTARASPYPKLLCKAIARQLVTQL